MDKKFIIFAACFSLALFFTISCSSDPEGGDASSTISSSGGGNQGVGSSSSNGGGQGVSSSSGGGSQGGGNVTIGTQTWMAENLDSAVSGSKCYGDIPANCAIYGRLYDWATAMALPSSCNSNSCSSQIQSPHRGICPQGWHIPSNDDWDVLFRYVDGQNGGEGGGTPYDSYTAGKYLKATSGWYDGGNGTDKYGFSALPGGFGSSDGSFNDVGRRGYWWSASEYDSYIASYRIMGFYSDRAGWYDYNYKRDLFSVRCLQD